MANSEGYEEAFISPPDEELKCPVCLMVARDPILTKCGHLFCETCYQRIPNKRMGIKECPIDRQELKEGDTFADSRTKRKILQLEVKCRRHDVGCCKVTTLLDLESHMDVCGYVTVACPLDCGQFPQRSQIGDHKEQHCRRRLDNCRYCEAEMEFCELTTHEENECELALVLCPLCVREMLRCELEGHCSDDATGDCPKTVVACEYSHAGCQHKCERQSMDLHIQRSVGNHMRMLLELGRKQSIQSEALAKDINTVKTAHAKEIAAVEAANEKAIAGMKKLHEKETKSIAESHRKEIAHLKDVIESSTWPGTFVWNTEKLPSSGRIRSRPFRVSHDCKVFLQLEVVDKMELFVSVSGVEMKDRLARKTLDYGVFISDFICPVKEGRVEVVTGRTTTLVKYRIDCNESDAKHPPGTVLLPSFPKGTRIIRFSYKSRSKYA